MPIVKFISDKDCQLFIDKEYVGRITNDSMLKQTLEPGGYLVEVKDEDALVLKKYNLEIKATDSHVLQDLSIGKETIDDVINQLRNDSSLVFHCNRAPFCFNGLYGYINKRFEVVIPAIYTIANKFKDDKAFVVREFPEGKKTTLIDEDGNMFFNRWFDYIGESEETILLGIDNRIVVYSKVKCDKVAEYYNAGYDYVDDFVPVFKIDGKDILYGYIDFSGNIVVPLIFSKVSNFKISHNVNQANVELYDIESCLLKKWFVDKNNKISEGDIVLLLNLDFLTEGRYTNKDFSWHIYPSFEDDKLSIKIVIKSEWDDNLHKEITEESDRILRIQQGYAVCRVRNRLKVVVIDIDNLDIKRFWFDADDVRPIFLKTSKQGVIQMYPNAFILKYSHQYKIVDIDDIDIFADKFEKVECFSSSNGDIYAIVSKNGKFGIADIWGKKMLTKIIYDNVTPYNTSNEMTFLLELNTKQGLLKGNNVIQPQYSKIIPGKSANIVAIGKKYGILNDYGAEIIKIENLEISFLGTDFFIVKREFGFSFGSINRGIIHPDVFDNILLLENNDYKDERANLKFLLVEKNGKQGCISTETGEIKIPIEFDKIELDYVDRHWPEIVSVTFILHNNGKTGYCEFGYYYVQTDFHVIMGASYDGPFEYKYCVDPLYDKCVLLKNSGSVLNSVFIHMHYAAVEKDGKWGILDQKPRRLTYHAIEENVEDENTPNLKDLDFKYDTLEELKNDADTEFQRRYDKYYQPWDIYKDRCGKSWIVKKGYIIEEPSYSFPQK